MRQLQNTFLVMGDWLNQRGHALNALANRGYDPTVQLIIGQFQVTDAAASCTIHAGETVAPCSSRNLFTVQLLVWNHDDEVWELYDDDWDIDGAGYGGLRQSLWKGEVLTALWDEQRNTLTPIATPPGYVVELTSDLAEPAAYNLTSATAKLQKRNPDTDAIEDALDADDAIITATVYNFFNCMSASTGDLLFAKRDGFGDLYVIRSCTATPS